MSLVLVLVMSLFAGKALVTASWPVCDLFDKYGLFAGSTVGARSSNSDALEFREIGDAGALASLRWHSLPSATEPRVYVGWR